MEKLKKSKRENSPLRHLYWSTTLTYRSPHQAQQIPKWCSSWTARGTLGSLPSLCSCHTCNPSPALSTHQCSRRICLWRAAQQWQQRWTWRAYRQWGCWGRSSGNSPRSQRQPGDKKTTRLRGQKKGKMHSLASSIGPHMRAVTQCLTHMCFHWLAHQVFGRRKCWLPTTPACLMSLVCHWIFFFWCCPQNQRRQRNISPKQIFPWQIMKWKTYLCLIYSQWIRKNLMKFATHWLLFELFE